MKCIHCGEEIANDSVFCEHCGHRIKNHKFWIGIIIGMCLTIIAAIVINRIGCCGDDTNSIIQDSSNYVNEEKGREQMADSSVVYKNKSFVPDGKILYNGISYGQCNHGTLVEPKEKVLIQAYSPLRIEFVYICANKKGMARLSLIDGDNRVVASQEIMLQTWGFDPPLVNLDSFDIKEPGLYYLQLSEYGNVKVHSGRIVNSDEFSLFYQFDYEHYCKADIADKKADELLFRIEGINSDEMDRAAFTKPFVMGYFYNVGFRKLVEIEK